MTQTSTLHTEVIAGVHLTKQFGYDISKPDKRRPPTPAILRSEDWELDDPRRRIAVSESRDLRRNFTILGWMVRRHLDYVARASFKCKIGDIELDPRYAKQLNEETSTSLNRLIEELVWEWSQPGNFEVTGRYSLGQFLRLVEAARVIDGDIGILKLKDGLVQAIEGDRIRDEFGSWNSDTIQGVKLDSVGRPTAYRIWRRSGFGGGNFEFERQVNAENMILHGYFDRFDQVRGIAPIVPAVRTLKDLYQGFDYALFKAKLSQMLGYKFTVNENDGIDESSTEDAEENTEYRRQILDGNSSWFIEMKQGEDMDIVAANTPTNEFQDYSRMMIKVALKALDIPYAMYDETEGKFYGNMSGIIQYVESCRAKRDDNVHLLNQLTRWRLAYEVLRGRLKLPEGMTVNDIYFVWTPNGLPWWNMGKETKELFAMTQYGLATLTEICQLLGKDYDENVRQLAREKGLREKYGLTLPSLNGQSFNGDDENTPGVNVTL